MHVTHQGQGHQARDDCASLPACPRLPLQGQHAPATWHTRHCPAQIQDRHIYKRLLLARPRRMPVLRTAQEQYSILAREDREKQGTRHRETHPAPSPRLAHNCHLGMTPLSVSFFAIVTRSGGKSATVWDAKKNEPMRTPTQEPRHYPTGIGTDVEQDFSTQQ